MGQNNTNTNSLANRPLSLTGPFLLYASLPLGLPVLSWLFLHLLACSPAYVFQCHLATVLPQLPVLALLSS